ncbi:hypothetical protein M514_01863 [Trichuris suis]|uniref:Uncharacterized protein n=1 Tax=Trichuris suis TaxID=68888 RepID=A0A085NTE3_9BILA|nr:hypothetical protein M514_01863 [Trichuris suis]
MEMEERDGRKFGGRRRRRNREWFVCFGKIASNFVTKEGQQQQQLRGCVPVKEQGLFCLFKAVR